MRALFVLASLYWQIKRHNQRRRAALAAAQAPAREAAPAEAARLGNAWSLAAARRWLAAFGADLVWLDGWDRLGGVSVFQDAEAGYLSLSASGVTVSGTPGNAEQLLAQLFGQLEELPF